MTNTSLPWLSIVTVVRDDPEGFTITRKSIEACDLAGVQWVIVDSSTPRVDPAITRQDGNFTVDYQWVPPAGIFPAMNEALTRCRGEYVWFLNAGDRVAGCEALEVTYRAVNETWPLWLVGQVTFVSEGGNRITPPMFDFPSEREHFFARGRFAPHQGTLVQTGWLKAHGGFDTTYRIAADYKISLELARESTPSILNSVIAEFPLGGASSHQWRVALREFHRARREVFEARGMEHLHELAHTCWEGVKHGLARTIGRV